MDQAPAAHAPTDWETVEPLLKEWAVKAHSHQLTNYEAAHIYQVRNQNLGIPLVIISSAVGTSIFATLKGDHDMRIRLVIGFVSVLSAALAAVQTFLRFAERAEKHRSIAARYGAVDREIEVALALPQASRGEAKKFVEGIKAQLNGLEADAPDIPRYIYDRANVKMAQQKAKDQHNNEKVGV